MDTRILLNFFHIILVAPFLLWIGIARGNLPESIFQLLIVLGILLVLYHGFRGYNRWIQGSDNLWINLLHVLWLGPLIFYIGMRRKDTPRSAYELLLFTTFGAFGYHLYELATRYDFL
jgi:hypothetical protein